MTADGGLILMVIGSFGLLWSSLEPVFAHRRWLNVIINLFKPALRSAFPPPPVALDLERLVVAAESALESDDITRRRLRRPRRI